jgi:hypothetical protein
MYLKYYNYPITNVSLFKQKLDIPPTGDNKSEDKKSKEPSGTTVSVSTN